MSSTAIDRRLSAVVLSLLLIAVWALDADSAITFDAIDQETGASSVVAGDLVSGDLAEVAEVADAGIPDFTGDDRAIVFTKEDPKAFSGASLSRRALAADHVTPVGDATSFLQDGFSSVIYRRGDFTAPSPGGGCVGDCSANGVVTVNELVTGVNLALGASPISERGVFDADGDGAVSIDELVAAVADALAGC